MSNGIRGTSIGGSIFTYGDVKSDKFDLNNISGVTGLSEKEASTDLRLRVYRTHPRHRKHTLISFALSVLREPMLLLLIASGIIYMILGDIQEAFMLLGFVFVIIGITLYQERKTERALEALRDLSSPRALVIRDGVSRRIAGREVVRGNFIDHSRAGFQQIDGPLTQ